MKNLTPLLLMLLLNLNGWSQPESKSCSCCTKEYRQFDFWIGDWDVYDNSGKMVGTNSISLEQDSCLLREQWYSASGKYSGTSLNFYNSSEKQWQQLWVDNQGKPLELKGFRQDNKMVLESEWITDEKNEEKYLHRITWTLKDDGSVRQYWESFKENELKSKVLFDGLYQRKKN